MDNASSNGTLIEAVADSLALDNIAYDSDHRRLRCNGHIINLVVQAFLFGAEEDDHEEPNENTISPSEAQLDHWRRRGPLGKLHNIIRWIMITPQRIYTFKELSGGLMPRRDNSTRWNL